VYLTHGNIAEVSGWENYQTNLYLCHRGEAWGGAEGQKHREIRTRHRCFNDTLMPWINVGIPEMMPRRSRASHWVKSMSRGDLPGRLSVKFNPEIIPFFYFLSISISLTLRVVSPSFTGSPISPAFF
jgi:hypothetical protein